MSCDLMNHRFRSVEEIKRAFFPRLFEEEQAAAARRQPLPEVPVPGSVSADQEGDK